MNIITNTEMNDTYNQIKNNEKTEVCTHVKYYNLDGICKIEVIRVRYKDPRDRAVEEKEYGKQQNTSMYRCNVCNDFGLYGNKCTRCRENSGSYYVGQFMNEDQCHEASEIMELEENEDGNFEMNFNRMYLKEILIDLDRTEEE